MKTRLATLTLLGGLLTAAHATMAMLSVTPTPEGSPKTSPRNSQSGSQSPDQQQVDKILGKLDTDSPRQQSSDILSDTPSIPRSNSRTSFTNTYKNIPCYPCIYSKDIGNNQSKIIYTNEHDEEITKIFPVEKTYNNEQYLYVIEENKQGVIEKYLLDLKNEDPEKKATTDTSADVKKPNFHNTLSDIKACYVPEGTIIYTGTKIEKLDNMVLAITYKDDNNELQTVIVENTLTPNKPTYASIRNNVTGKIAFAIDLQTIDGDKEEPKVEDNPDISQKSRIIPPHNNNKDSRYTTKLIGGFTLAAICILLAYKYNQLPAAFEKILDHIFAQFAQIHFIR